MPKVESKDAPFDRLKVRAVKVPGQFQAILFPDFRCEEAVVG
jgi:hypothetical protein